LGHSVQFTATGTFSDGSTADLTATVSWTAMSPDVASIAAGGEATGLSQGVATITASSGGISGTATLTVTTPAPVPPNIVVVMVDDLDVTALNNAVAAGFMPNLKKYVIDRGVTFNQSYVADALCCPSRSTFLSGQYSHNHGVLTNRLPYSVAAFHDSSSLATWLRDAGYTTGLVGKYLNLYGAADVNHDGVVDGLDSTYIPPGWDDWQAMLNHVNQYNYTMNDNGTIVSYGSSSYHYQTDVVSRRAVQFLNDTEANDSKPFFLFITPTAPHVEMYDDATLYDDYSDQWAWDIRPAPRHLGTVTLPLPAPPAFNEADTSDKPGWVQSRPSLSATDIANFTRQYQDRIGAMRAVDDLIGSVLSTLNKNGEWSSTVFLFTSDNGFLLGEHRLTEKEAAYEETIRVPLYVRRLWLTAQSSSEALVVNTDLAPTIAELAGAVPGLPVDGTSMVPLLDNPTLAWRKRFLVEHKKSVDNIFAIPDYGAVRTGPAAPEAPNQLYVQYIDGTIEFYDLGVDPKQLVSLHADHSPIRASQRQVLSQWLADLKACGGGTCQALEFQ
jgi:arylsulfatase A-like enzyme